MAVLYVVYAVMVGVHTLAFWNTMPYLGTVPVAISKGAQQAMTFLLAHILFCHDDDADHVFQGDMGQCMTSNHGGKSLWSQMQKSVSFAICCLGCLAYAVSKPATGSVGAAEAASRASESADDSLHGANRALASS